jgi:hypothetical protein
MLEINLDLDTFISNYAIKISLESVQVAGGINFLTVQIPHSHVPGRGEKRARAILCPRKDGEGEGRTCMPLFFELSVRTPPFEDAL